MIRRLSAASYRKMLQNLWWAVGAVLMSTSMVVVALNAQLLRRANLRHHDDIDDRASPAVVGA